MTENPKQRTVIIPEQAVEEAFQRPLNSTLHILTFTTQHSGAHHRRERERHEGRDDDRTAQCDGKLAEEPPHDSGHEEQGNEDGNQRDA